MPDKFSPQAMNRLFKINFNIIFRPMTSCSKWSVISKTVFIFTHWYFLFLISSSHLQNILLNKNTPQKTGNVLEYSFLCILDPPPMVKPFNQVWSHCYFSQQCTIYRTFCISLGSVAIFAKRTTCICHNYWSYITSNFQPVEIFCIYNLPPTTATNTKFQ